VADIRSAVASQCRRRSNDTRALPCGWQPDRVLKDTIVKKARAVRVARGGVLNPPQSEPVRTIFASALLPVLDAPLGAASTVMPSLWCALWIPSCLGLLWRLTDAQRILLLMERPKPP
jgi:hypothetical protein